MKSRRFPQAIEPRRPKTHWDHVIEEMVWLSKDFESERKWKLAQAKKVALRASKGMLDVATRGEKKQKEEEQRLRKVALNISKDVKKFWVKIEKLVIYKHQMDLDEKKKKALDKQLEFLLGQTERYSTMLAENLVDKPSKQDSCIDGPNSSHKEGDTNDDNEPVESNNDSEPQLDDVDDDVDDYDAKVEDESEDDEHTIEEDEALITAEERQEELAALHDEVDLPLEELLKRYAGEEVSRGSSPEKDEAEAQPVLQKEDNAISKGDPQGPSEVDTSSLPVLIGRRCEEANGKLSISENHEAETHEAGNLSDLLTESSKKHVLYDFNDDQEDGDFVLDAAEEKDDETTLLEEEELAKEDANNPADEISLLQKESEIPLEELLARYKKEITNDEVSEDESESASALSDVSDSHENQDTEMKQKDFSVDGNVEYDQSLSNGLPVIEEEKTFEDEKDGDKRIEDAAAAARSAQPTGNTFLTTKVRTKFPFLLKYPLREYQHIGLDWLVTMYEKRLNGILADEMGLGKTIMTIALLAHLACEKGIWGPHLIVVPTSVMLNWETEFLKWCPAFKILTYFGSAKERKFKRQGWMKPNSFHICITTYRLVIQDSKVFKRKKWKYLILDEAHLIKNWKSQRWQTLLNFNSKRRILLTGTPLQNDIMELWSLMHFLMPHVFHSHQEFKDWFSNPISGMVEGQEKVNKEVIDRLHNVLRPFILRRLKRDVETQLPMKHEHVIYCRLSKRQRNLYEDFIASSETQATLASSNFFGMISVIMQLRKVCNHPDLFEGRPIISSFDMAGIDIQLSSSVCSMFSYGPFSRVDLCHLGLIFTHLDFFMTSWEFDEVQAIATPSKLIKERAGIDNLLEIKPRSRCQKSLGTNIFDEIRKAVLDVRLREAKDRAESIAWWNSLSCRRKPIYSTNLRELVTIKLPVDEIHQQKVHRLSYLYSSKLAEVVLSPIERFQNMIEQVESFMFAIPAARAIVPACWCSKTGAPVFLPPSFKEKCSEVLLPLLSPIRPAIVRRQVYFPDRRLIQFDCGKLQELAVLLRKLKSEGHRALIFTQMTKMLDVLEAFINLYGYTYMRLDGSTQPEERQTLMQRFNTNPKIFLFILSTRSGGVGINLVGADTVIFYDSDWNPAMDQQAQDRCHRIGQTREVHIYRLISESTIEENILKKANQKRALDDLVIQSGGYNTEFFKKLDPMELFSGHKALVKDIQKEKNHASGADVSFSNDDVEAALKYAEDEADYMALKRVEQEEAVDNQEFTEEAIGRLEDDELVNDDDMRTDEPLDQKVDEHNEPEMIASGRDNGVNLNETDPIEEQALTLAANEDDLDMLADVKQMAAAAAAAGQTVSFENHLRPIDRYAIRFLELWDPIVDKAAIESPIGFEETEWELDRIEKYKDEMEAEIDDDEEPFVYERWDTEFATEAYRQHVEALAQHQLMEEMEAEANEKQLAEDGDFDTMIRPKPKSKKKKAKKSKFKSLKKGSLASELKKVKEEPSEESISFDDEVFDLDDASYSDNASPYSSGPKKRRADLAFGVDTERSSSKKSKKPKKALERLHPDREVNFSTKQHGDSMELKSCDSVMEHRPGSRNKAGGKLSITSLTVKRILTIKPEKLKKGNTWSRDCVPSPDLWSPQEDTILCAVVHEYGPHWSLVSETLYGMTAGGFYRGRYRHPVHCCERFRELIQKYVLSSPENPINEKMSNAGSTKALLRVTEDHIRTLLNVAVEQPDNELLLQKHFTALLSSAWRMKSRTDQRQHLSSSRNGLFFNGSFFISSINQFSRNSVKEPLSRMKFTNLEQNSKLLASALHDACSTRPDEGVSCRSWRENFPISSEQLELTLEFQNDDSLIPFPSVVNLSIPSPEPPTSVNTDMVEDHLKPSTDAAESRFRDAAESFFDDSLGWASSAFMVNDAKSRGPSRPQTLGKHKLPISEVSKPPRSKMKRTSSDQNEARHLFAEPVLHLLPTVSPNDPNLRFEPTLTTEQDHWADDTYKSPVSNVDGDLPMETSLEAVPDNYDSDLILGLDDCSLLAEYTDIG